MTDFEEKRTFISH